MSRFAFALCLLSLFLIASVQAQMPSLDDVKTIQGIVDWFKQATEEAGNNSQTHDDTFIQANKKVAELAKGGADVDAVIAGFKSVVTIRRRAGKYGNDDYTSLEHFLNELEKARTHPDSVSNGRYSIFTGNNYFISSGQSRKKTLEEFDRIMVEAKKWSNAPPPGVKSTQPLLLILELADSHAVRTADPDCLRKTIERLTEFAQSDEMTAPLEAKKETDVLLKKYQRRQIGSDPKLYGKTLDDKEFKWNSLQGKYVLIQFTATWCGPCKKEISGMLDAYEKYKGKEFEIVSVYIWQDRIEANPVIAVRQFVRDNKLPWIILSEALTERAKQPKQGEFYAIRSVPTMLLVDKEGKIIMTDARSDALKTKLAEIFK